MGDYGSQLTRAEARELELLAADLPVADADRLVSRAHDAPGWFRSTYLRGRPVDTTGDQDAEAGAA